MRLFSKKQPERTPKVEESPEELATIKYVNGPGGKGNKANFLVGTAAVPASVITRLEKACQDKPEQKQAFIIHTMLEKRYGAALESIEMLKMSYPDALRQMISLRPSKKVTGTHRGSRIEKTATVLAKAICRRFRGSEEEIASTFFETTQKDEFRDELRKVIQGFKREFGQNSQGYTKTSKRAGRPDLKGKAIKRR